MRREQRSAGADSYGDNNNDHGRERHMGPPRSRTMRWSAMWAARALRANGVTSPRPNANNKRMGAVAARPWVVGRAPPQRRRALAAHRSMRGRHNGWVLSLRAAEAHLARAEEKAAIGAGHRRGHDRDSGSRRRGSRATGPCTCPVVRSGRACGRHTSKAHGGAFRRCWEQHQQRPFHRVDGACESS